MNFNEILTEVSPYLLAIILAILGFIAKWIGAMANAKITSLEEADKDKKIRAIIESTVKYVEQIGKALDGPAKLDKAKETALAWINEKGLIITETELNILIEATVNEFFENYNPAPVPLVVVETSVPAAPEGTE